MAVHPIGRNLDPDRTVHSPYEADRVAPPTVAELAEYLGSPKSEEKAIKVGTTLRPELVFAIDRIIEKRIYNLHSRYDFLRLATMNLAVQLVDEIQQKHVKTSLFRLEEQRRVVAELLQMKHVAEMVEATKKAVELFLSYGNRMEAIKALRNAKRFSEEIPYEGLRARFVNGLYGSDDGTKRPARETWGEEVELWHQVLEGDLDRDDEDEIARRMGVY